MYAALKKMEKCGAQTILDGSSKAKAEQLMSDEQLEAYLDMRINSKLQQIESLNALATSCTSVLTGMPRNPSHITSRMADCVGRIIDLENEIRNDMNELLDLKRKIMAIIKAVDNPEHQALLLDLPPSY